MPPTPIDTLFEQLDDGKLFAAKGHEVIDDSQLMRWVYDNVKNTGLFDRDCEKWRKKPQAEADEDRKENAPTATKATYTANQVQEIFQNEINTILQASDDPTDDTSPPPPPASANTSVTADDVRHMITESFASTKSETSNNRSNRSDQQDPSPPQNPPIICQAIIDEVPLSYC